ncbi:hypothetical protein [Sorangium sp. So ce1182]
MNPSLQRNTRPRPARASSTARAMVYTGFAFVPGFMSSPPP